MTAEPTDVLTGTATCALVAGDALAQLRALPDRSVDLTL
jgi:hypothetical protein